MFVEKVTFFRPQAVSKRSCSLPAEIYNQSRVLLNRSELDCQFVPIRSMQYQGVITKEEVIFVDSQGYAVSDGEGGRLIVIAWQFGSSHKRESLTEPVNMEVVYYHQATQDLDRRLLVEFKQAMKLMLDRQVEAARPGQHIKVVPITGTS